jgi:hypothetical protein
LRVVFDDMDATGTLSLDMFELSLFMQYSFAVLFGVELSSAQVEEVFLIVDTSLSTSVKTICIVSCE